MIWVNFWRDKTNTIVLMCARLTRNVKWFQQSISNVEWKDGKENSLSPKIRGNEYAICKMIFLKIKVKKRDNVYDNNYILE